MLAGGKGVMFAGNLDSGAAVANGHVVKGCIGDGCVTNVDFVSLSVYSP